VRQSTRSHFGDLSLCFDPCYYQPALAMTRFTDHLRTAADPIWQAMHDHALVRSIGEGNPDLQRLRFWMRQDYLFLIDYARLFALAAARAPDLETMTSFARLCHETLEGEMTLHRSYAEDFGISTAELESETKSAVTQAYTDFLLRTAALGDYSELVAALLPCMWGFSEVGTRLKDAGVPEEPLSARWVEMYGSQDFAQLAAWCRDILDVLAGGQPQQALDRMQAAFIASSRHELAFWDQALTPTTGD
jgi:thiaminase/transcriptional activator TenA